LDPHYLGVVAFATALYSTSVLDRETVFYFPALHETRFVPTNIAYPPVDLMPSRDHVQSVSEKPLTNNDPHFAILRPIRVEFFKYLSILFTAAQCTVVGACRN
jgi:hypothetical protein